MPFDDEDNVVPDSSPGHCGGPVAATVSIAKLNSLLKRVAK